MGLYFTEEDKSDLLKEVSARTVIDYLNIETKKVGSTISILCPQPEHNDRHYGSCVIVHDEIFCYACRKKTNTINLLMWEGGMSYYEAICTLAELSGHPQDYEASKKHDVTQKKQVMRLNNEQKALIGLSKSSYPRAVKNITFDKPEKGGYFRDENGEYVICDGLGYNPWLCLAKDEPENFKWMVQNKCLEKMTRIISVVEDIKSDCEGKWSNLFTSTSLDSYSLVMGLAELYKEIEAIYREYGGCKMPTDVMINKSLQIFLEYSDVLQTA